MKFLKKLFGKTEPSGVTMQKQFDAASFQSTLEMHIQCMAAASSDCAKFAKQYLDSEVILMLAAGAVEKMTSMQTDGQQHSLGVSRPPVFFNITSLPVGLSSACQCFAQYGGYMKYLTQAWNSPAFQSSGCSVWFHVLCGPEEGGHWVQITACSVRAPHVLKTPVLALDLLTRTERKSVGL